MDKSKTVAVSLLYEVQNRKEIYWCVCRCMRSVCTYMHTERYKGSSESFRIFYFTSLFYWWLQKQSNSVFYIITLLFNTFFPASCQLLNAIIIENLWLYIATDAPCSLHPHHIKIFSLLELLEAVQKGENQMAPNVGCEPDVPRLLISISWGFTTCGPQYGDGHCRATTGRPLTFSLYF
jgi:hypothetical protein